MSLAGLLFDGDAANGAGDPDEVIVSAGDDQRRRGELRDQAEALAVELRANGVEPGHGVAVSLPSGPDVVAALFGVWLSGAVYVPLNPRLSPTERDRILTQIRPAAILTAEPSGDRASVHVDVAHLDAQNGVGATVHDADVALIQFTSGTTGRPKAVPLRHSTVLELLDGVVASLRGGAGATKATGPARMPNVIPVSLSLWAGLYNVLFALRVGAPIVVLDPFTTSSFERVVKQYGIRSTVLPPAAMTMLADDPAVVDLTPLRFVRSITAPLSPLQARRFRDKFEVSVLNCYGQTEIGGEIVGWNAADSRAWGESKLGSVGRPHAGVEIRAVDPSGAALPVDEAGELCVRTPALDPDAPGREDLADRLTPDGWFRTGDIGRVDPEGFVWIEGRVSDMINRGGLKVFPEEVAEVLRLAPDVDDAAVVGVPDPRLGEVPVAFIVPTAGADELDTAALDALCRDHLAPYKVPVRFMPIDALPRNEIGKVLAVDLVSRAEAARVSRSTAAARLLAVLRAAGIDAIYGPGAPWPGTVDSGAPPEVSLALAAAHDRVFGSPAAVHLGDGQFVLGDLHASERASIRVATVDELDALLPRLTAELDAPVRRRVELEARFDPEEDASAAPLIVPPSPATWLDPPESLLADVAAAGRPMLIVGPGVVRSGVVADLHAVATAADLGVLNTWGAKGIFDWRSRHHWATVGLQARDLELGGVPESDLVLLIGIDPDEIDLPGLDGRPAIEVAPAVLGPLAEGWVRPRGDGAMPELRARLASVTQAGWASTHAPLAPSQVTRAYGLALGTDGFVAADPGLAGYWVARTFATTAIGGAKVPARRSERGFAIAAAIVARLRQPGRRVLAVSDAPLDDLDHELLAAAERLGTPVALELWDPEGMAIDADAHASQVRDLVTADRSASRSLATDHTQLDAMIEAAGPVTAWEGLVDPTVDPTFDRPERTSP